MDGAAKAAIGASCEGGAEADMGYPEMKMMNRNKDIESQMKTRQKSVSKVANSVLNLYRENTVKLSGEKSCADVLAKQ